MGRYLFRFFFFFFVEPYYYSLLFLEGDRQESLDHRLDDGDRVCCVVGRTQTHIAKPVSLSSIFFFFSLLSLIFFLLLLISLYNKYTLLPYPFPSSSLSIFYVCVCWLAGCLVYPTAAQRQANEKRRTVMDARP